MRLKVLWPCLALLAGCGEVPFRDATTLGILYSANWRGGVYRVRANVLSGDLIAQRETRFSLRFGDGAVQVGAEPLRPGCVVRTVSNGMGLHFEEARQVQLDVPPRAC